MFSIKTLIKMLFGSLYNLMANAKVETLMVVSFAWMHICTAHYCVNCNQLRNPICATKPETMLAQKCRNPNEIACYTLLKDNLVERGCLSDLSEDQLRNCENEVDCEICTFESCNRKLFPEFRLKCFEHFATYNGSYRIKGDPKLTTCLEYSDHNQCAIRRTEKLLEFGCLSSMQTKGECLENEECYTCDGDGCNIFQGDFNQIPLSHGAVNEFRFKDNLSAIIFLLSIFGIYIAGVLFLIVRKGNVVYRRVDSMIASNKNQNQNESSV